MSSTDINTCEDALRVLAAHLDRELDLSTAAKLERHLATCRSCYSRAEFEKRLKANVARLASEPVHPELSRRVQSLIRSFAVAKRG